VTTPTGNHHAWTGDDLPTEEIGLRCGVAPIRSTEDLDALAQPELWDYEADYEAFLVDLYAARRTDIG